MLKAKVSELIDLFVEGFRTDVLWEVISIELYFVSWEAYSFEAFYFKRKVECGIRVRVVEQNTMSAHHRAKYYALQRPAVRDNVCDDNGNPKKGTVPEIVIPNSGERPGSPHRKKIGWYRP